MQARRDRDEWREERADVRSITAMYLNASMTAKRKDGQKWDPLQFAFELWRVQDILRNPSQSMNAGPGAPAPETLDRLAVYSGMESGQLSGDEWAAIQQAERDRIAKIKAS